MGKKINIDSHDNITFICDNCGKTNLSGERAYKCQHKSFWGTPCQKIVCSDCVTKSKGKYYCLEHIGSYESEGEYICGECDETFILTEYGIKQVEKKGKINAKCPHC